MPMTVAPKDSDPIRRKRAYQDVILTRSEVPTLRGPELPEDQGIVWCQRTREWYATYRQSEIAALFEASDWDTILDTAVLHNRLWSEPNLSAAAATNLKAEIRRTGALYGATLSDRLLRRIKFSDEAPGPAGKASPVDYREMFKE